MRLPRGRWLGLGLTLLAYLSLVEARQPADALVGIATWTILLSVLLHGLTAQPLAAWYARRLGAAGPGAPALAEGVAVPAARARRGLWPTAPEPLAAAAGEEASDGRSARSARRRSTEPRRRP